MLSAQIALSELKVPNLGAIVPNMGTSNKAKSGLGDALFSKTQQQVLGLLFGHPERSYYANEIVRLADIGIGTVHRELEKLSAAGLLIVKKVGNQKHYQANHESPIFEELRGIVLKTFGIGDVLRQVLVPFADQINLAFIYGSMAKGTDTAGSDIDVMIVSDELSYSDIFGSLTEYENRLGRVVNPTVYDRTEFQQKLAQDGAFLSRIVEQPKIMLIGTEDDIAKFRKSG